MKGNEARWKLVSRRKNSPGNVKYMTKERDYNPLQNLNEAICRN